MKLKINKQKFLDWRIEDESDYHHLADLVTRDLIEKGTATITMHDLYKDLGYLPKGVIVECDQDVQEVIDNLGEYAPNKDDEVEWV